MDLSADTQNLHEPLKFIKSRNETVSTAPSTSKNNCDFDTIDISRINFGGDETWLYEIPNHFDAPIKDLKIWLYNESNEITDEDYFPNCISVPQVSQNDLQKNIDTRTFTRPKKRFTRPSIEKYNEEVYGNNSDIQNEKIPSNYNMTKSIHEEANLGSSSIIQEVSEPIAMPNNPLNFDLSQPTSSYYFENVLANSAGIDSFQNMSPPSLVNSMCSSTFANLMENSFIKNDPILREIRDTDYTETVLLQDSEPPMFQSITESCSSLNSDSPENFLKKVSYSGTFRKNSSSEFNKTDIMEKSNRSAVDFNITFEKPNEDPQLQTNLGNGSNEDFQTVNSEPNFNSTYRRTPKPNNTFRKSDARQAIQLLNSTFEMSTKDNLDHNKSTLTEETGLNSLDSKNSHSNSHTIIIDDTVDDKKQLSETVQITDLNRLSYCLDDENVQLDSGYTENDLNRTVNMKRSSLGCSTGSADSLDRMSSLSNSSRESNKMLNMSDVDAIVEMQERSLQQVMSTPKPNTGPKKLWENNFISPIISNEHFSDSDLSSNDEYKSVKSSLSKISLENYGGKTIKSMSYIGGNIDTKIKTNQRSTYTMAGLKPLHAVSNSVRGSYSNLKTIQSNILGSHPNIYQPNRHVIKAPASTSNLLSMGQKLKGSYTSLRPISANLPVAPPITPQLNTTLTIPRATNPNVTQNIDNHTKVVEVPPMPRGRISTSDHHFIKPQQPRTSGLPRPTGIPRPASRIPGPRSNVRPNSSRSTIRRQTKDDYQ